MMNGIRGRKICVRLAGTVSLLAISAGTAFAQTSVSAPPATDQQAVEDQAQSSDTVADIVVTGSRLATSGFSAPTPVTVVGAQDIARQGAANIADVLNTIPAFRPQSTPATAGIFAANAGANLADLRGLGGSRTLVLVNGRRVVAGTVAGSGFATSGSVDLNIIPTALIARTEVVTGGASAAYGSDAVAGVVNLILDTGFEGIRGSIQSGISQRGDAKDFSATLAGGTPFADGRGHIIAGGEYQNSRGLGDCYTRDWCAVGYNSVSNPTPQANGLARILLLPNTRTATSSFGGLITSGPLRGTEFGPNGTTFQHDYGTYYGTGPTFANGGLFQSGGGADPVNGFYNNYPLYAPVERYSTLAHATFDLSDKIQVFAEGSYAHVDSSFVALASRNTGNITIQRDNAFLPADIVTRLTAANAPSFSFGRIANDIGPFTANVDRETYRAATGISGTLDRGWKWDASYQYGRTNYHALNQGLQITDNFARAVDAVRDVNGKIVCRSTLTTPGNGCQPLNLFGQNQFSQAAVDYAYGSSEQSTRLTQQVAGANLNGDLFDLPGGPLSFAVGGEYRIEDVVGTADALSVAQRFANSPGVPISGPALKVKEGYVEFGAPLITDRTFFHSLALNGAARITDYSTSGSVTTWKIGGVWEPTEFLRLRGTRSRDIRAPNFFELYSPTSSSFQFVTDPQRGNGSFLTPIQIGGNIALRPEIANTLTAGVVFSAGRRFQLSADYYDIDLAGAISTLGAQVIVTRCAAGSTESCGLVSRDTAGAITSIANINLNLGGLKTRGLDVEASGRTTLGGGDLSLRVLGTYIFDLTTIDVSGNEVDRAGMNGSPVSQPSGVPRFQGNAALTWSDERFSATVQARYVHSGVYNATLIGPGQRGYDPTLSNSISDNKVGAATYVNLNTSYRVVSDENRTVELFAVVNNLFDRDPPNNLPSSFGPTNPVLYDVVGRAFKFGVRFTR